MCPLACWWTFGWFPVLSYCGWSCYERVCTSLCVFVGFCDTWWGQVSGTGDRHLLNSVRSWQATSRGVVCSHWLCHIFTSLVLLSVFQMLAIRLGVCWCLTEILICVSRVTKDADHLSCASWSLTYFALRGVWPSVLPTFNEVVCVLVVELFEVSVHFRYTWFVKPYGSRILLFFAFLLSQWFLSVSKILNVESCKVQFIHFFCCSCVSGLV